jgi:hypothetical protein
MHQDATNPTAKAHEHAEVPLAVNATHEAAEMHAKDPAARSPIRTE